MTQRDIRDYLQDILATIDLAESFVTGMTFGEFQADAKTCFAVIRALEVIGEATKNIPASIRDQYPAIPWKGFAGMRDKLIHAYFGVNLEVVWDTLQQDLPQLRPVICQILQGQG
ncbi:MAG: DUF86 domain-containing protein [Aphanocapsa sp. GSE-SYN-MK-11-07L]|nr:DUF86 domain-containing protein [Aphanocapsa sp. GSE-SYN-MK-11-07L]